MEWDLFTAAEEEQRQARAARDEALTRVLDNEPERWKAEARQRLQALPHGWTGTAEDIRMRLTADGLPRPHHHNVWGGFINGCLREGLIQRLGMTRNMRGLKSHARKTDVYRVA